MKTTMMMSRVAGAGALLLAMSATACDPSMSEPSSDDLAVDDGELRFGELPQIEAVFFGQTHVQRPDDALFRLVGERDALVEAFVVAGPGTMAVPVTATLMLDGQTLELELDGPAVFPETVELAPGVVDHRLDDSFTGVIPAQWVQPGLEVSVRVSVVVPPTGWGPGGETLYDEVSHAVEVGAPTRIGLSMFDIHFFAQGNQDFGPGWFDEVREKWPVADLDVERTSQVFEQVAIPPRKIDEVWYRAVLASSKADYEQQLGVSVPGSSFWSEYTALGLSQALRDAGAQDRYRLTHVNIIGQTAGGLASRFVSAGKLDDGIPHHELGHALSLPHCSSDPDYPYVGEMFGIEIIGDDPQHVGPTWGLDLRNGTYFIPPTVQPNTVAANQALIGTWKRDPMQGGGKGDQEQGQLLRMFSDYSVAKMRDYLEDDLIVWNEDLDSYARWDALDDDYTALVSNDDLSLPLVRDVEVISVLAAMSAASPEVDHVYPPIGAYTGNLAKTYRIGNAGDRALAEQYSCPADGCDYSLRIKQANISSRTYLLPVSHDPGANPLAKASFSAKGVNLDASNGAVTSAELLLTPDGEHNGAQSPAVLASWTP